MSKPKKYFASLEPKECVQACLSKIEHWAQSLETNGYYQKMRDSWAYYHGAHFASINSSHKVMFSGDQGELANLAVNHFRNIGENMLVMTTSNRPTLEARSVNTDYKSLVQTNLANGLLDYYMREKRLERHLKTAVQHAIVLGSGYVRMGWNATTGELFDYTQEGAPIYQGDVEFSNPSPFDVIFDPTKESSKAEYLLVRNWKNRYDLAAKFPEYESEILGAKTKAEIQGLGLNSMGYDDTDDIGVWELYHERSESVPEGRYVLFVDENSVLIDSPLPYRSIPIFRVSPSLILGTPFGYSNLFDIIPIQEAINSLYSTVLTNQQANGVQNLFVPAGANIQTANLAGGLNIIEGTAKPEPLNLTQTPAEIFNFLTTLEKVAETISGVNSVARGNPDSPSLRSGNALALVQSMALQFMSGLQQQYVELCEDVGTGLINLLKDFAAVPRIAAIVGKNNRTYMKEFKGDDLQDVNRVIVDLGNPLARTTAGRVQMAEQLLQMGAIKTPEHYIQVMNTGKLEVMTESTTSQLLLTKGENESMMGGESVPVIVTDNHKLHIEEHSAILADPTIRRDPELTAMVLEHVNQHIEALRNTDPSLLTMLGQQPLQPMGAPLPGAPGEAPPQEGDISAPKQSETSDVMGQPVNNTGQNIPSIPDVDPNLLPNPGLQAQNEASLNARYNANAGQ